MSTLGVRPRLPDPANRATHDVFRQSLGALGWSLVKLLPGGGSTTTPEPVIP